MPIIKSAKKRVRTAEKAAIRNSKTKRYLKTALKSFRGAITGGSKVNPELTREAQSAIDIAAKKGLIHKNKAARQKAQLARAAKAAGVAAPTAKAKKAVTKKPAATKAASKATKPAAKKTTTKKPVAAKAPAKKAAAKKTSK